ATAFDLILARLEGHREKAVALLNKALAQDAGPVRPDPFRQSSWERPSKNVIDEIERAQGFVWERFALCQTISLERFQSVAEGLRGPGYRPVRARPYEVDGRVQVAAVWLRDGRDWEAMLCVGEDEVPKQDRIRRQRGYEPVDI